MNVKIGNTFAYLSFKYEYVRFIQDYNDAKLWKNRFKISQSYSEKHVLWLAV